MHSGILSKSPRKSVLMPIQMPISLIIIDGRRLKAIELNIFATYYFINEILRICNCVRF